MAVLLNGTNGLIQAYDYQTPATGFSYTFAAGTQTLVMNPAGTLAAGTITMPAAPSDGMTITFSTTQQITAVTLNGNTGQTVVGGVSYLPANTATAYVYRSASTSWFPAQAVPLLAAQAIGYGQTWTNVAGSRALGTTYTNSTGRTIAIQLAVTAGAGNTYTASVGAVQVLSIAEGADSNQTFGFLVPPGATYIVNGPSFVGWVELR
jgi:hypothetical protein